LPASRTFYRITGGFLNAAKNELEILLVLPLKSPKLKKKFIEASRNLKVLLLTIKMREKIKSICTQKESTN
jgi:hypothetical protein